MRRDVQVYQDSEGVEDRRGILEDGPEGAVARGDGFARTAGRSLRPRIDGGFAVAITRRSAVKFFWDQEANSVLGLNLWGGHTGK